MNEWIDTLPAQFAPIQIGTAAEAFFYFTVYSFMGWLLENGYHYRDTGRLGKDGFLWGPFKPMYGFAPVILLLAAGAKPRWDTLLLLCLLVPTAVEYVSGFLLQRLFRRRWWDYSKQRYQLRGHVCLTFSLYWFVLSLLVLVFLHPWIAATYERISSSWVWISPAFAAYFGADLFWAFRTHRHFRALYDL